jgi:hypothetical protein
MDTFPLCFGGFLDNYIKCLETVGCLCFSYIASVFTHPPVLDYYNAINIYIRHTQLIFLYKTSSYMFRLVEIYHWAV